MEKEASEAGLGNTCSPSLIDKLEEKGDEELKKLLEDSRKQTEILKKENALFEKCLRRIEAKEYLSKAAIPPAHSTLLDAKNQKKKIKAQTASVTDKSLCLTAEQKCDLATREIEEVRSEKQRKSEEQERSDDNFKAVFAEADMRLAELKKRRYEFDRDIVRGAVDPHTGNIVAEKVIRYFEDQLKSMDLLIEKLVLKNASLKTKKRKLVLRLKQKEEAGDVRTEVDYEQLKIENTQFNEKFAQKNQELLNLKLKAGKTLQTLNAHKKELHTLCLESSSLDGEIAQREELLRKIDAEAAVVEQERVKAENVNREAKRLLEDYRVPNVMEYVQEKANLYELKKAIKVWERKVEIAEMGLWTQKQKWRQICMQSNEVAQNIQEQHLIAALL